MRRRGVNDKLPLLSDRDQIQVNAGQGPLDSRLSFLSKTKALCSGVMPFLGRFRSHVSKQSWLDLTRPRQYLVACARYIFTVHQ